MRSYINKHYTISIINIQNGYYNMSNGKSMSGGRQYPKVYENAEKILKKRYYHKDKSGNIVEDFDALCHRVARVVSSAERLFRNPKDPNEYDDTFFEMIRSLRFLPNTPTLINAGRQRGQLAACYVLPTEDSMEGIMDTLKNQALVQKSGGGTGFSFSCIREKSATIASTDMKAAGPVPVIKLMNYLMSEFITQGGVREGANMAVLPIDHNDIEEFITFKSVDGSCKSFNVSVAATDEFMRAVENDGTVKTRSRLNGATLREIRARELFNLIAEAAWATGDPGILFIDTANKFNPTPNLGRLEATNPCGEQWLLPNEACTLGHLNLSKYYINREDVSSWEFKFDWEQYNKDIKNAVRFLDNVIEINHYATSAIEHMHRRLNRKIGLGIIGFADLLIMLGIPYASEQARAVARGISYVHRQKADEASMNLGYERGSFGAFPGSKVESDGWQAMRNACRTTVAPTGTTAIIAHASTAIEINYSLVLHRHQAGMDMYEIHPLFEELLDKKYPLAKQTILAWCVENGGVSKCPWLTAHEQQVFATANEISYLDHIAMQAVWQEQIDNSISKTINMSNDATVEDIKQAYMLAWKSGCKGITIYRDGSRTNQALSSVKKEEPNQIAFMSGGANCPECSSEMEMSGGCQSCRGCGYAVCKSG